MNSPILPKENSSSSVLGSHQNDTNTEDETSTHTPADKTSDDEDDSEGTRELESVSDSFSFLNKTESLTDMKLTQNNSTSHTTSNNGDQEEIHYYLPKSLCIVSRYPFFSTFRECLRELFLIYRTKSPLPVECYIHYLTKILPIPRPGSTIHFQLYHKPIQYSFPSRSYFPTSDVCKKSQLN